MAMTLSQGGLRSKSVDDRPHLSHMLGGDFASMSCRQIMDEEVEIAVDNWQDLRPVSHDHLVLLHQPLSGRQCDEEEHLHGCQSAPQPFVPK